MGDFIFSLARKDFYFELYFYGLWQIKENEMVNGGKISKGISTKWTKVLQVKKYKKYEKQYTFSAVFSGGAGGAIWGFRKGAKPDFCLSDFSYYSKHLWIWKAIYGAGYEYFFYLFSGKSQQTYNFRFLDWNMIKSL